MITLSRTTREALERATVASQKKPVEFVPVKAAPGLYNVRSASKPGEWYVAGFVKEDGKAYFLCGCPAGMNGKMCRHYPPLAAHYRAYLEACKQPTTDAEVTAVVTTLTFAKVTYVLETLTAEELGDLHNDIVDYGANLVDRAATWSMAVLAERRKAYDAALAENNHHLELLNQEWDRRDRLARLQRQAEAAVVVVEQQQHNSDTRPAA